MKVQCLLAHSSQGPFSIKCLPSLMHHAECYCSGHGVGIVGSGLKWSCLKLLSALSCKKKKKKKKTKKIHSVKVLELLNQYTQRILQMYIYIWKPLCI